MSCQCCIVHATRGLDGPGRSPSETWPGGVRERPRDVRHCPTQQCVRVVREGTSRTRRIHRAAASASPSHLAERSPCRANRGGSQAGRSPAPPGRRTRAGGTGGPALAPKRMVRWASAPATVGALAGHEKELGHGRRALQPRAVLTDQSDHPAKDPCPVSQGARAATQSTSRSHSGNPGPQVGGRGPSSRGRLPQSATGLRRVQHPDAWVPWGSRGRETAPHRRRSR